VPALPAVRYRAEPVPALFLDRPNRYLARVRLPGSDEAVLAHVPNPGRMEELLRPGRTRGWVVPVDRFGRRTAFDLIAVRHRGTIVSVDSRVANRLVGRVLEAGLLPELGPGPWRAEQPWGGSRFDFARPSGRGDIRALLEVKSSNLRQGEWATFPDAPTTRGTRHLRHLAGAARSGVSATVLFAVQRSDVRRFRPNARLDPEFAAALSEAARAGVKILAHTLHVLPGAVRWGREVPVELKIASSGLPESI